MHINIKMYGLKNYKSQNTNSLEHPKVRLWSACVIKQGNIINNN